MKTIALIFILCCSTAFAVDPNDVSQVSIIVTVTPEQQTAISLSGKTLQQILTKHIQRILKRLVQEQRRNLLKQKTLNEIESWTKQ